MLDLLGHLMSLPCGLSLPDGWLGHVHMGGTVFQGQQEKANSDEHAFFKYLLVSGLFITIGQSVSHVTYPDWLKPVESKLYLFMR